ncbi:hypothetical protein CFP56_003763 [Quercus suber]|uniref:Uncharacterized protein n=1 Tax=Quercus suber TaxID=58331 RepID=A0AAW0LE17_QUESU
MWTFLSTLELKARRWPAKTAPLETLITTPTPDSLETPETAPSKFTTHYISSLFDIWASTVGPWCLVINSSCMACFEFRLFLIDIMNLVLAKQKNAIVKEQFYKVDIPVAVDSQRVLA